MSGSVKVVEDLPEADYHSQKCAKVPRLTYSIARELLFRSPFHAYDIHPLLGGNGKESTEAMDDGSIIHSLLFGKDTNIVISPYDSFRTNEAKAFKQEVIDSGRIIVKQQKYDELMTAYETIKKNIMAEEPEFFNPDNKYEVSAFWTDDNGVEWQSRFDCVNFRTGYLPDFKLTTNASRDAFERKIQTMGYYLQEQAYTACFNRIVPELAGRTEWKFVVAENKAPHAVAVVETDGGFEQLGMAQIDRASKIWKECLETGVWKGYGKYTAFVKPWAFNDEMEE